MALLEVDVPAVRQGHYRDTRDSKTRVLVRMADDGVEFNDGKFEKYKVFQTYYRMVNAHEDTTSTD